MAEPCAGICAFGSAMPRWSSGGPHDRFRWMHPPCSIGYGSLLRCSRRRRKHTGPGWASAGRSMRPTAKGRDGGARCIAPSTRTGKSWRGCSGSTALRKQRLLSFAPPWNSTGVSPHTVTTDKAAAYPPALAQVLPAGDHITGKAERQRIERDHQRLKGRLRVFRGGKTTGGVQRCCSGTRFCPEPPPRR